MKIFINGMSCEHCVEVVTKALEGLKVSNIHVNLEAGFATFDGTCEEKLLRETIEELGYEVGRIESR